MERRGKQIKVFIDNIYVHDFLINYFLNKGFLEASCQVNGNQEITEFPCKIDQE